MSHGRRGFSRVAVVSLGAVIASSAATATAASKGQAHGWSRPVAVVGLPPREVVFDRRDRPWVTVEAPLIARLDARYRLADRVPLPHIPGQERVGVAGLAADPSGDGAVLLSGRPAGAGEDKLPRMLLSLARWRPGGHLSGPTPVAQDAGEPAFALSSSGLAVALWAEAGGLRTAREQNGRRPVVTQLAIPAGERVDQVGALPAPGGRVSATWTLSESAGGLRRIASGFAETSPGAAFGAPLISPVPGLQGSLPVAERLTADARGDQEILLTAAGAGSGAEQLYLTSRSASGAFTSPRLLGSAFRGAQSTMSSNGHFTVIWRAADRAQVMAVSGRAGAALGAVQQISTGPPEPDGDPPLLAETSRRKVLALWPVRSGTPQAAIVAVESTIGRRFSRPRRVSVGGRFIHGCDEPVLIAPDRAAGVLAVWSCVYHAHGSIREYSRWRP